MRSQVGKKSEELFHEEMDKITADVLSGALTPQQYSYACGRVAGLATAAQIIQSVEEDRDL